MSIESEITRLVNAKQELADWLTEQNVAVPTGALLGDLVALLGQVKTSSSTGATVKQSTASISNGEIIVPGTVIDERDVTDNLCAALVIQVNAPNYMLCMTASKAQYTNSSYTLNTENMPILSTLQSWKYGFRSPIISDLFFVSLKALTDNKWGTRNPFIIEDPTFGVVRVRGFGTFSLRVVDVEKFMRELVGVQMIYQTDDVIEFVRSIVIESLIDVIAEEKIRVVELASKLREISEAARDSANEKMETMGISLLMINIENISLPEEVEKFIDEQSGINLVSGNMQNFQQWQ